MITLFALFAWGCTRTVYVPAEAVRVDSVYRLTARIDTVVDRDSVLTLIKGDTVYREAVRWRIRTTQVHDTCYIERTDSVPVPYPVERRLSRWERAKMDFGGVALTALALGLCVAVAWLVRRCRKR